MIEKKKFSKSKYKSIDEMLTKMPDDQVKVLKEMVRNERNSMKEKEVTDF